MQGHKPGLAWPGWGVRVCVCAWAYPVWPHLYLVPLAFSPGARAQVARGGGGGRAPLRCTLTTPPPGPMLTAWSRSVSSLRRFLHLAAANLLRSRRTLLFSSSSGVS